MLLDLVESCWVEQIFLFYVAVDQKFFSSEKNLKYQFIEYLFSSNLLQYNLPIEKNTYQLNIMFPY